MPPVAGIVTAIGGAFSAASAAIGGAIAGAGAAFGMPLAGTGLLAGLTAKSLLIKSFVQIAAGMALGAIGRALQSKPKAVTSGTHLSLEFGETTPLAWGMGRFCTAGELIYHNSWDGEGDTPNEYYVMVIQLSDMPSRLRRCWINGEWVNLKPTMSKTPSGHGVGYAVEGYEKGDKDRLFVKFRDGTQVQADGYLLEKFGDDEDRPWLDDMVGMGMTYAIVTADLRKSANRQKPQCRFELDPYGWYDRRKASSAGGSGAQRFNNWKTWKPTDNPIVLIDNIVRGIYDPITGEHLWGGRDVTNSNLTASYWFAAMNACDNLKDTSDGPEPEFRAGMEVKISDEPASVVEIFLDSCLGRISLCAAQWQIRVGAPSASVFDFDENYIIVTEDDSFIPVKSPDQIFNGISATYPAPRVGWQNKESPVRINQNYVAEDLGKTNIANVQYRAVPYPKQVQRLMKAALRDERRMRTHTMTMPPEFQALSPLDEVSFTSSKHGYDHKLFSVELIEDLDNGNVLVALRERDPSDYDYDISDEYPDTDGYKPSKPRPIQIADFTVSPYVVTDADGDARAPGILLEWSVKPGVTGIRYRIRRQGTTEELAIKDARSSIKDDTITSLRLVANGDPVVANGNALVYNRIDNVEAGSAIISGKAILNDTTYEVNAKYEPVEGKAWLKNWLVVTTPDVRLTEKDFSDVVNNRVNEMEERANWAAENVVIALAQVNEVSEVVETLTSENLDELRDLIAELEGLGVGSLQEIRGIAIAGLRKGWIKDPTFDEWTEGANPIPVYWTVQGLAGFGSKSDLGYYPSSLLISLSGDTVCQIIASSQVANQMANADPSTEYVVLDAMIRGISGLMSQAFLRVEWHQTGGVWYRGDAFGQTNATGILSTQWGFTANNDRLNSRGVIFKKPSAATNPDGIRVVFAPKPVSTAPAISLRVDYLDVRNASEAEIKGYVAAAYTDAAITSFNATLTGPTGAIATQINTVRAEFLNADAVINSSVVALATEQESLAGLINAVQARTGGTNLVSNPQFYDGVRPPGDTPDGWASWPSTTQVVAKDPAATSAAIVNAPTKYVALISADTSERFHRATAQLPVVDTDLKIKFGLMAAGTGTGINHSIGIRISFYDANGDFLTSTTRFMTVTSVTWTKSAFLEISIPAGTASMIGWVRKAIGGSGNAIAFTNVEISFVDEVALARAEEAMEAVTTANSSFATITSTVNASFGSWNAFVTQSASAVATSEYAYSALVFRVIDGEIKLVGWDDEDGVGSAILLNADNVIAPGTLSTGSLVVTDLGYNMVPDDQLQSANVWNNGNRFVINPTTTHGGAKSKGHLLWTNTGLNTTEESSGNPMPVYPGQRLKVGFQAVKGSGGSMTYRGRLRFTDRSGSLIASAYFGSETTTSTSIRTHDNIQVNVPSGAFLASFRFQVLEGTTTDSIRFFAPSVINNADASVLITPDGAFFDMLAAEEAWIKKAMIASAQVGSLQIDGDAVTIPMSLSRLANITATGSYQNILDVNLVMDYNGRIAISTVTRMDVPQEGGFREGALDIRVLVDSEEVWQQNYVTASTLVPISVIKSVDAGTRRIRIQFRHNASNLPLPIHRETDGFALGVKR